MKCTFIASDAYIVFHKLFCNQQTSHSLFISFVQCLCSHHITLKCLQLLFFILCLCVFINLDFWKLLYSHGITKEESCCERIKIFQSVENKSVVSRFEMANHFWIPLPSLSNMMLQTAAIFDEECQ
jgi:hypothetical protein